LDDGLSLPILLLKLNFTLAQLCQLFKNVAMQDLTPSLLYL